MIEPSHTGALLVTLRPRPGAACLVIGGNRLAASRVLAALEAGYRVYVGGTLVQDDELRQRIARGQVTQLVFDETDDVATLRQIDRLDLVCVTDSLLSADRRRSAESCDRIAAHCHAERIHVNFVDQTQHNDVSFPATHRWRSADGTAHALQIAVNTFGKGCRLATRIKREIVSHLPAEVGRAVDNIALIRSRIVAGDARRADDEDDQVVSQAINTPVRQFGSPKAGGSYFEQHAETTEEAQARRMKWMAQVSEYWPIKTIGRLRAADVDRLLADFDDATTPRIPSLATSPNLSRSPSATGLAGMMRNHSLLSMTTTAADATNGTVHDLELHAPERKKPRIVLLGSGPGHPSLLTVAAHTALRTADLVLADKLVPSPVLSLIPATVETTIAKKFPGNAENAQTELQNLALQALQERERDGRGGTVVRLKQGDPYVYGRGGEEVLFFRAHGYECIVVPGVSSALAAPLMFDIPVTQRGVADSMLLCTGVGRAGKTSVMPGYRRARTLVVLMGVARIGELVHALTSTMLRPGDTTTREGEPYPSYLPIAVIERGSSRDQRLIMTTLADVERVINEVGDQRPPGMLVIGWVCLALEGQHGNVDVTEPSGIAAGEQGDRDRVRRCLGDKNYIVREGIRDDWREFLDGH